MDTESLAFRLIFTTPALLESTDGRTQTMVGSAIERSIREFARDYLRIGQADEDIIFGNRDASPKIKITDLKFEGVPEIRVRKTIDPSRVSVDDAKLWTEYVVPSGAMVVTKIEFDQSLTEQQRIILRSSVVGLERAGIGGRRTQGYGLCKIDFVDFQEIGSVFLSYTWESTEHAEWVLYLAHRLTREGIYVILDQYDLTIGSNIHVFMEKSIERAMKVMVILTPTYKSKAEERAGGVGFEYSLITSELFDTIANNKKFLPILRHGAPESSIPKALRPFYYCDMRDDRSFEHQFTTLYSAILGKPLQQRPPSRV